MCDSLCIKIFNGCNELLGVSAADIFIERDQFSLEESAEVSLGQFKNEKRSLILLLTLYFDASTGIVVCHINDVWKTKRR